MLCSPSDDTNGIVTRSRKGAPDKNISRSPDKMKPSSKKVNPPPSNLQCFSCKVSYPFELLDMSKAVFTAIQDLYSAGTRWHCSSCLDKPNLTPNLTPSDFTSFKKSVQNEFISISNSFEEKIDQLKSSFLSKLETFQQSSSKLNETITTTYASTLSKNLEDQSKTKEVLVKLTENVESLKDKAVENEIQQSEIKLKERKKLNVMMFRLPESTHDDPLESFKSDFSNVLSVIDPEKTLVKEDIVDLYRIGEKKDNYARPIVIRLKCLELKQKLLDLRNLSVSINGKSTRVFLAPDRTPNEVKQHKALIAELERRKMTGSTNLVIRGGKIVEKYRPFRFKPLDFFSSQGAGGAKTSGDPDAEEPTNSVRQTE